MALSQATVPHKRFITALVRRRVNVSLPLELDLSLGMRKYVVIFTGEREAFPLFWWDLSRYVLPDKNVEVAVTPPLARCFTLDVSPEDKGKKPKAGHSTGQPEVGAVELCSRPGGKDAHLLSLEVNPG